MKRSAMIATMGVLLMASTGARAERPETEHLIAAGAGMSIPTYFLGVAQHEGTHALVARLFGARIHEIELLPGRGPDGRFYFGYVRHSRLPEDQSRWVLLAPKLVNLFWLAGYATLVETETLPTNHYAQLSLAVLATGQWADLSKDLALFWRNHDINRVLASHQLYGFWEWLPWRLLHVSLSAATGYVVYRGYRRIFTDREASSANMMMVPLGWGHF